MADNVTSTESWVRRHGASSATHDATTERLPSVGDRSAEGGFTSVLYRACVERLSQFVESLKQLPATKHVDDDNLREVAVRFRLFGGSFEHGKLDSSLDDDELFETILHLLVKIAVILKGFSTTSSDQPLDDLIDQAKSILSLSEDGEDSLDSEDDEDAVNASLSTERAVQLRCRARLSHNISMLMELLPTLEAAYRLKHTPRVDRNAHRHFRVTSTATPYVRHIRDKFPHAHSRLADRLGEANWQRHERLRNPAWKRPDADDTEQNPGRSIQKARTFFDPVSIFKDSALGSSLNNRTEKAASVASHSSFLSSALGDPKTKLRVPKMPEGTEWGSPFACPYCASMIDVHSRVDWKLHVYSDLQAYICTHEACPQPFVTYDTRGSWAQHELDHHLSQILYQCSVCLDPVGDQQGYFHHVDTAHGTTIAPCLRQAMLANAQRRVQCDLGEVECSLCLKRGFNDKRDYSKHVGRHLEDIALIALPPTEHDDWSGGESEVDNDLPEYLPARHFEEHNVSDLGRAAKKESLFQSKMDALNNAGGLKGSPSLMDPARSDEVADEYRDVDVGAGVSKKDGLHSASLRSSRQPSQETSPKWPPLALTSIKAVISIGTLPTIKDHVSDVLGPEGDEYIPRDFDEAGETKIDSLGFLRDGREYNIRTFILPGRGQKLFMLATECARKLEYQDLYLLFWKNNSLYKIIASAEEKEHLVSQEILPNSYRSRQIAVVTARSIFRQFGSRVVKDGRRVRDDYWEAEAIKQGFTDFDADEEGRTGEKRVRHPAGEKRTGAPGPLSPWN